VLFCTPAPLVDRSGSLIRDWLVGPGPHRRHRCAPRGPERGIRPAALCAHPQQRQADTLGRSSPSRRPPRLLLTGTAERP
jgi:hypothetical protein